MAKVEILNIKVINNGIEKIVHPVVVIDENEMIMIDAGYPNQIQQFLDEGEKLNLNLDNLTKIVVTHHDYDHIGSLADLKKYFPKAEIISSEIQADYINGNKPSLRLEAIKNKLSHLTQIEKENSLKMIEVINAVEKCNVDKFIAQDDLIGKNNEIICIETPGHMPGHISVYVRSEKTLITGDAMNLINGELSGANPDYTFDMEEAKKSIKKFLNYDIENIICYHGGEYTINSNLNLRKLTDTFR